MSAATLRSSGYNLVADARKQHKELVSKGQLFALYLNLHHLPRAGSLAPTSSKGKEAADSASAPCWLPPELLKVIVGLLGQTTLEQVLMSRQRALQVLNVWDAGPRLMRLPHVVLRGFPRVGDFDSGYQMGVTTDPQQVVSVLRVTVQQYSLNKPLVWLMWRVVVDLSGVCVDAGASEFDIEVPSTAISVFTNASEKNVQDRFGLTQARVDEMIAFRLRGLLMNKGKTFRFMSEGMGPDQGLAFEVDVRNVYKQGMKLDKHGGFAVGDRVRLTKTYKAYEKIAFNLEGVIRMISLHACVMYFVELAEEGAPLSRRIAEVHDKTRRLLGDQRKHHVAAQWFHLQACDAEPEDFNDPQLWPALQKR